MGTEQEDSETDERWTVVVKEKQKTQRKENIHLHCSYILETNDYHVL